jgi:hypothetical protein
MDGQSLLGATTRAPTAFHLATTQSKAPLVSGSWADPWVLSHQHSTSRTWETLVNAPLRYGLVRDLLLAGRAL